MKDCGGGGKEGNIPPAGYVPECFSSEIMCLFCNLDFNTQCTPPPQINFVGEIFERKIL